VIFHVVQREDRRLRGQFKDETCQVAGEQKRPGAMFAAETSQLYGSVIHDAAISTCYSELAKSHGVGASDTQLDWIDL
jgi:hypothetical protein